MSPIAVDVFVRALVLLTAAWTVVTILRRRSASFKAMVWTAALAGVLILPALNSVLPRLDVPIWSAPQLAPARMTVVDNSGTGVNTPSASVKGRRVTVSSDAAATPTARVTVGPVSGSGTGLSAAPTRTFSLTWSEWALVGWALVAFGLITRLFVSHLRLSRLARTGDADSDARDVQWAPLVDHVRTALGISRVVRVRTTDAIGVPAIAGVLKPVLLLPAEADDWDDDVKRAVVLHELAHVARWDAMGQLLGQLACAVYWCVPLVWHGAQRAAILREHASDDVVLMSGVRASAYAENLLNVARLAGDASLEPATLAMAHPHRIKERIMAILDPASAREGLRTHSFVTVTIATAALVALVAAVQPTTRAAVLPAWPAGTNVVSVSAPSAPAPVSAPAPADPAGSPAPAPPAEPVALADQASRRPCERDMKQNSSSSHDDGTTKRWTVKMSGADCAVDMQVNGTVEFNDTFTDVKTLGRGGSFKLDVTEGGVRHELEMRDANGTLTRVYRVDGRERAFDTDARTWFGEFLITLDRRTAVGVDVRLPQLLKQGGVDAVLRETALMTGDHARSRYFEKLIEARQLTDPERARVLQQAASLFQSDHYASTLLSAIGKGGFQDTAVRTAALAMIDRMESDHYRAAAVEHVIGAGAPGTGDMDVLVRTVERIESDHYKLEVLKRIVTGPLQAQHRAALARAARTVESDHYIAEFLKALAQGSADGADRQVFFDVIGNIKSDHYVLDVLKTLVSQRTPSRAEFALASRVLPGIESGHYRNEAIQSLLVVRDLNESDLLGLMAVISTIDGDHYKAESLQAVARHRGATDRVRTAVLDASERMSSHYRDQVRRAAGKI